VQWTTGNVGKQSVAAIARKPDLDLVGCYAWSADKVGRDVGELCGLDPLGVTATDDVDALLALRPDCVMYNPMWLVRILEAGVNVVTTAAFINGRRLGPDRTRLVEACERGRSSLFGTGINPGFVELLSIVVAGVCDRIDKITVSEAAHFIATAILSGIGGKMRYVGRLGVALCCALALAQGAGALTIDNFEEGDFSVGPQASGPPAQAEQTGLAPANVVGGTRHLSVLATGPSLASVTLATTGGADSASLSTPVPNPPGCPFSDGCGVAAVPVAVDLKPGTALNCVNPRSKAKVQVALLGSSSFDVLDVDASSLSFGGAGAQMCKVEDVAPFDGFPDCAASTRPRTWAGPLRAAIADR
jgi:hypothetical protein